jgi:hypothetical protein
VEVGPIRSPRSTRPGAYGIPPDTPVAGATGLPSADFCDGDRRLLLLRDDLNIEFSSEAGPAGVRSFLELLSSR